jgi:Lon-like protease
LCVSLLIVLGLVVAATTIKVPYVILQPGPVTNTLGTIPGADTANGQPGGRVITIKGPAAQTNGGRLYLTTVSELPGSCSAHPTFWQAVKAWFDKTNTVEPQQVECPPGQSSQQVQQQDAQQMSQSQSDAVTAALFQLGYKPASQHVTIASIEPDAPANSVLENADTILALNGHPISTIAALHSAIEKLAPNQTIHLTIQRNGKTRTVTTTTFKGDGGAAMLGITADRTATFPNVSVKIGINPDVIGGPSAGTALALGIIDKLTPGGLTGGKTIAGTGTVDGFGSVGPIGGIQQKIAAAHAAGATVFFAPASECGDAKAAAPKSMTLISVKTLSGAVQALKAIKAGSTAFPHC